MKLKTYIEFGHLKNNKKNKYQLLSGDLYDNFMLLRYFRDIYNLNSYTKKNGFRKIYKELHHKKDLKFNIINFLLLKTSKQKKYYEFGQTLFEKIYFFKFLSKFLKTKINLNINWYGNDISKMFNFFCINFYKEHKLKVFEKANKKLLKNSVFFSKGISLLYDKNNISFLKNVLNDSNSGFFDFTVYKNKNRKLLNTGYYLYYPSLSEFLILVTKTKNKTILFKNIKQTKNSVYFEIVFGKKLIIRNFLILLSNLRKKFKNKHFIIKAFDLNSKFTTIDALKSIRW
jgi:hypothetical protein